MTKLEVSDSLVTLLTGSSQLFSENEDFIMKYEVDQSSMNSPSFAVFHYYLEGDVDVVHCTMTNALFNGEMKNLQSCCIFFEELFFKPMEVKGDGSYLYGAVASHIMSCCLDDV